MYSQQPHNIIVDGDYRKQEAGSYVDGVDWPVEWATTVQTDSLPNGVFESRRVVSTPPTPSHLLPVPSNLISSLSGGVG